MKLIVAFDTKNGIGKDNTIPWFIKSELSYFKKVTTYTNDPILKNVVIMGRKPGKVYHVNHYRIV